MPRAPLPIGTWGAISTWVVQTDDEGKAVKHKSQARFRDHDGRLRPVSAYGKTKTAAERALLKKLQNRTKTNQSGELTAIHKINHLLDLWERRFEGLIADGKRSPTSLDTHRRALKNHIRPALGELRIGEATTPRIDTVLTKIKHRAGAPTAKTCRAIISGARKSGGCAERHDDPHRWAGLGASSPGSDLDPRRSPSPNGRLRTDHAAAAIDVRPGRIPKYRSRSTCSGLPEGSLLGHQQVRL